MSDDEGEEWDEDIVIDLRKFAVEQATIIHLHKRDGAADANAVFTLADRIVNYVLGEQDP